MSVISVNEKKFNEIVYEISRIKCAMQVSLLGNDENKKEALNKSLSELDGYINELNQIAYRLEE